MCKENNLCLRFIYAKLSIALQYFQDICNIEHSSEDHQALKIRDDPKYISIVNILTFWDVFCETGNVRELCVPHETLESTLQWRHTQIY